MNETHPCPKCGEVLEVPATMLGQPVRCGACSNVFTPGGSPLAVEFDAPLSQPRRRERRATSSRTVVFIVLGFVAFFGLLCCGGIGYIFYAIFNPQWQTYDSPAGDFTAQFPGEVQNVSPRPTGRPRETAPTVRAIRNPLREEFFVTTVKLSNSDLTKKPAKLLDELASSLATTHLGSREQRPKAYHTHHGCDAIELCLRLTGDHYLQARIVIANGNAYIVGVDGPGEPDDFPWVDEFLQNFQPKEITPTVEKPRNGGNPFRPK